ncbi:MAG: discoidin domain-containing protein [Elusimicrobiota bacterium]
MRKSALIMVFSFICMCFALPVNSVFAAWLATASSSEGSNDASSAVDDDPSTRWSSEFKDNQWWQVDFGEQKKIEVVVLLWEAAYTKEYNIEVSKNGKSWKQIYATKDGKGGKETIKIKPVTTRFVKINCVKRGAEWGNSLWEVKFDVPAPPTKLEAAASSGNQDYSADKAVDGDMSTRWSSDFADNQWWEAEFVQPKSLCGIVIHWETAFGEIYNIEAAGEDGKYKKVYETADGDGNRDIIYFQPMLVKKLRLNGIQRGTGWGFSIWEIDFLDGLKPPVFDAVSRSKTEGPELAMDGDRNTAWHSPAEKQATFSVELPRVWGLGGLVLQWGKDYAVKYSVELFGKDGAWKKVYETDSGNGNFDQVYFQPFDASKIRINCLESKTGDGFDIAELEIKGNEEKATPIKIFQSRAKDSAPGLYPMWLRRVQEFWTVLGEINDEQESLFSETGIVEPYKESFLVKPYVFDVGKLITYEDCKVSQGLEADYLPLPSVNWKRDNFNLEIKGLAYGKNTIIRYRVANTGTAKFTGKLALGILPVQLNPIWQHGGISPINSASFSKDGAQTQLKINGGTALISLTQVSGTGAMDSKDKDVAWLYGSGQFPQDTSAESTDGLVSCGLWYDLDIAAGQSKDVYVVFPLYKESVLPPVAARDPEKYFDDSLNSSRAGWEKILNKFAIDIPDKRLVDVMKTNIAYILINMDGPWTKPGSRNYNHSWLRDGAMTCVALMQMGLEDEVLRWVEAVSAGVDDKGMVPFIFFEGGKAVSFDYNNTSGENKEYDSQGEYLFAVREYYDYTKDKKFLKKFYPKALKAAEFIKDLRRQRMTDEYKNDPAKIPYYGILPLSNSHEGYYPAKTSYWDDFWCLRGLKDAIYMAKTLGNQSDAEWLQNELLDFRKCVIDSILAVIARDKLNYIPGCVEKGDFDATSTAIAITAAGEENYLPQEYLKNTFDKYMKEFVTGMEPGKERTFTPYEDRNADAFIRMGQRENGLTILRYFVKDSVRPFGWNHMAEVVHAKPRAPSYIGDMPHTWVGSGYINAVRTIFAYEYEGKLIIGAGLDPQWFDAGISVKELPTIYGTVSYTVNRKGGETVFKFEGKLTPPEGFVLPLPKEFWGYKAVLNKAETKIVDGKIAFKTLPAVISLKK